MKKTIYSNMAIDMGGKFTGVISYSSPDLPKQENIKAAVIKISKQDFTSVVAKRTLRRHQIRSSERYKLARKLIYLLLSKAINRSLTYKEQEAISSLMLRRGYTRQETEISDEVLDDCAIDDFVDNAKFTDLFDNSLPLKEQFYKLIADKNKLNTLYTDINDFGIKNIPKDYRSIAKCMSAICNDIIQQDEFGHKHRKVYFEEIAEDLKHDSRLKDIREALGEKQLFNLVANISNLQLRALRWYFDDPKMQGEGFYDSEKLKNVLIRAYKFFHYKTADERFKIASFIKSVRQCKDAINLLFNTDPLITIPPYEDQNDRHPPVDLTLLLNPVALDRKYSDKWQRWALSFVSDLGFIDEELSDDIVKLADRKSRLNSKLTSLYTQEKLRLSYVLQRVFDLSRNEDKAFTKIRAWVKAPLSRKVADVNAYLLSLIGEDELADFESLAKEYYEEIELAKKGLWSIVEDPILEISNIHPQAKKKNLEALVANVLCVHENFDLEYFKNNVWTAKKGNSSVRSLCKNIEEKVRKYNIYFNSLYTKYLLQNEDKKNITDSTYKDILSVINSVNLAAELIAENLNLDILDITKFSNPFSLAQLYNLLEKDIDGFSSNCLAVIKENNYRMRSKFGEGALCSRLAAESVRPFDGALRKILERQAYEIAKIKVNELLSLPNLTNTNINIGILVEENNFEFSSSIKKDVKDSSKKTKKVKKKYSVDPDFALKNKKERIISDSKKICAYTGDFLSNKSNCEFDHIISRSRTMRSTGSIFNSELNLIYVSRNGNQQKKEIAYDLNDLSPKYLREIFGTNVISEIKSIITETVDNVSKDNKKFLVDAMTPFERICCRHALFMPETKAYDMVINALAKSYSTIVNGTQLYLIQNIIKNIKLSLGSWLKDTQNTLSFEAFRIDCDDIHFIRGELAENNSLYIKKLLKEKANQTNNSQEKINQTDNSQEKTDEKEKKDIKYQPITSHAIDALCVLAAAFNNKVIVDKLSSGKAKENISKSENLEKLIPQQFDINIIERKNFFEKEDLSSRCLFNDSIYAEHFMPIIVKKDLVKIGFDFNNSVEVKSGGYLLIDLLKPFFKEKYEESENIKIYHLVNKKVFEFLERNKHEDKDSKICEQKNILNRIHYATIKKELEVELKDESFEIKLQKEKGSDKKNTNFEIKIGKDQSKSKYIKVATDKTLIIPSKFYYEKLVDEFNRYKSQKTFNVETYDSKTVKKIANDLKQEFVSYILNKESALKHKKYRHILSVSVACSNLAKPIRVKRKNLFGEYVYQLLDASESIIKGFYLDNNIKDPIAADIYKKENLYFVSRDILNKRIDKPFIHMSKTINLVKDINVNIDISLYSFSRREAVVTMPYNDFNECLNTKLKSYLHLEDVFVLSKDESKNLIKYLNNHIIDKGISIGSPREGKLYFKSIGKSLIFKFTYDSKSQKIFL